MEEAVAPVERCVGPQERQQPVPQDDAWRGQRRSDLGAEVSEEEEEEGERRQLRHQQAAGHVVHAAL